MRRVYPLLLFAVILALLLSGCGASSAPDGSTDVAAATPDSRSHESLSAAMNSAEPLTPVASPEPASGSLSPETGPESKLKQAASDIVDILRDRDLKRLAETVDPDKGLRFSPYSNIDAKSGQVFKAGGLPTFKDATKLTWGSYDGRGEPIELTFRNYFEKFVYDQDFAGAPSISVNKLLGVGNMKFNGKKLYPNASFVEYHFPGFDKKNNGMDWESLVLVLVPSGNDWKLCAIVHNQWTI
ncbi:MAG: hypothetical protein JWR03_1034 [Cohnella sp.]|nr:hypothetical protein [Cohnella sp.]